MKATLNVSKSHYDGIIKELDKTRFFLLDNADTSRPELFNLALAFGLNENKPTQITSSTTFVRTEYVERYLYQYRGIYFDKIISNNTEKIDEIVNDDDVLSMMEQYANTGFDVLEKLMKEVDNDEELFSKKLLKRIGELYNTISESKL